MKARLRYGKVAPDAIAAITSWNRLALGIRSGAAIFQPQARAATAAAA